MRARIILPALPETLETFFKQQMEIQMSDNFFPVVISVTCHNPQQLNAVHDVLTGAKITTDTAPKTLTTKPLDKRPTTEKAEEPPVKSNITIEILIDDFRKVLKNDREVAKGILEQLGVTKLTLITPEQYPQALKLIAAAQG